LVVAGGGVVDVGLFLFVGCGEETVFESGEDEVAELVGVEF